jgi:hypothetical protein
MDGVLNECGVELQKTRAGRGGKQWSARTSSVLVNPVPGPQLSGIPQRVGLPRIFPKWRDPRLVSRTAPVIYFRPFLWELTTPALDYRG